MRKIILGLLFLALGGFLFNFNAPIAKAMTFAEIQAMIAQLQQQIAALQKQLAETPGAPVAWCHTFNVNLKIGMGGSEVEDLHLALEKEGFSIDMEEKNNKSFDESTASAITGFQQKYQNEILTPLGLKYGTGFAGKATRVKLNKLFGCGVKATPAPFCSPVAVTCESTSKIVCPAGLNEKGCPFPCKCVPVACAQDVKTCPDGTIVSRIPPSCEFASCPNEKTNQSPVIYGVSGPTFLKVGEVGTWTVKASDPEQGKLIYSVAWGDESAGVTASPQAPPTDIQGATFSHSYSKAGIYSPTFTVTDNQGLSAKTSISVKVEETISPLVVAEQVKCVFGGAQTEQKCYASDESYYGYGCSGIGTCVVDVKGTKGNRITWKSSCGGYAYTTIDGQNEYAEFSCPVASPSITVLSPNGGESWIIGSTQTLRWDAPSNATMRLDLVDEQKQLVAYNLANVSGNPGSVQWSIPSYISAGRYLVKAIACIGSTCSEGFINMPTPTACTTSNCYTDYSDNYFSIVSATTPTLPDIQITDINPASVNQNQFTNYTATVKNNSSQDITTPFTVNLGGIATNISQLSAWQTATVNANFGLTILGPNQVCARVDIWNTVPESNESNNDFCKTVNVVTASVPSVTVLSPNGGESWIFGNAYGVTWKSSGVKTAFVYLWFSDGTTCKLADVPAEQGKYSVQFTENQLCTTPNLSIKMTANSQYRIKIYTENEKINDSSDNYFSMVSTTSASATPIVTVTYPNGGETWTKDMTYGVKWSVNGLFAEGSKRLTLEKSGARVVQYSGNAGNADLMSLTLSSADIAAGDDYKIKIELVDTNGTVIASDVSDNYFSIIAGGAGLNNIENQLADISKAISGLMEAVKNLMGR